MLVMVVFFIAFRWIHLSTPLIRLFLLVLILLLMPTLKFLPVWFDLSLLGFRLHSRLHMMFILWMFFSSIIRHTRFDCDWSSDVCSSDLIGLGASILIIVFTSIVSGTAGGILVLVALAAYVVALVLYVFSAWLSRRPAN